jgi:Flp pilus assembly protein TadG
VELAQAANSVQSLSLLRGERERIARGASQHKRAWLCAAVRSLRSLWYNREGSALVEATVTVPVLFTLTFGVYEFSWVFYTHQSVSTGVRDAARYAARAYNPANPCDSTTVADAKNLAVTGQITSGGMARVSGWTADTVDITCTPVDDSAGTYRGIGGGSTVATVTASTSFTENSLGFFPYFGLTAPTISVSHSERAIPDTPNP